MSFSRWAVQQSHKTSVVTTADIRPLPMGRRGADGLNISRGLCNYSLTSVSSVENRTESLVICYYNLPHHLLIGLYGHHTCKP